ncbi:DNA polymerase III subunit gamma/tau [Clostridium tarantellae]|uniref:DNA-directed DNA polymerase n=1 Tax=Clostridium tarantellae TaxID=39493 RepID=A0A6I1MP07_9CLOT|nr:DNA polymerase III subunit gamma/tau [Clostridium tarantellae]MPQ44513.1 DNA polymerase III subunit gamma/tau [Clostridium tarantellae]
MSYKALYREWRPKVFEDVVGQEHITTTLKNQIINNRTAHAYLFCGTRGTGKTSTAKVFAKALNCLNVKEGEPCNECDMCKKINESLAIDVTELDAASNNGVDKIRDIIEDVQYPPQEAKYKVYIMDEVHMLSMGAVNAFLKTLEEPPQNVIFILATTDPQKLPITILSRCQRFDFKRISKDKIVGRLRKIVTEQGVLADDKSLELVARISDGAMRDSLSILDQAISMNDGKVDYNNLLSMLGLVTNDNLFKLVDAIIERNIEKSMIIIEELVLSGKDIYIFIKDLMTHYRNLLMIKVTNNPEEVLDTSHENITMLKNQGARIRVEEIMRCIRVLQEGEDNAKFSKQARMYLELSIIKICKIEYDTSKEVLLSRINKLEEALKNGKINLQITNENLDSKRIVNKKIENKLDIKTEKENKDISFNSNCNIKLDDVKRAWKDILESFKSRRAMVIYASLVTGRPVKCEGGIITICYEKQYEFNKVRLEKNENKTIVQDVISEILKDRVKVVYAVNKEETNEKTTEDLLIEKIGPDVLEIVEE